MVVSIATCPPHHWLVEEHAGGGQRWSCYRCGEAREQAALPPDRPCVSWAPRQPGDERDAQT
jgi:hypothetical protein